MRTLGLIDDPVSGQVTLTSVGYTRGSRDVVLTVEAVVTVMEGLATLAALGEPGQPIGLVGIGGYTVDIAWLDAAGRVVEAPDVPHLPAAFLSVFAAPAYARTIDQVAAACYRSRKTVQRDLAAARQALGLPPGTPQRFRPTALAAAFAVALGRDPEQGTASTSALC